MHLTENIFDELADDLRDDYIEDKHGFDVDEWPPDQPTTIVNVALIHYKGSRTEQELIEISKRHKEGTPAVDKLMYCSKVTKDISKIFQRDLNNPAETGAKPPKFILIEGAPGIGKTVLAKKIAYLWAKKQLLIDVKILFLLFLRDPKLQIVKTAEELIQYLSYKYPDEEQAKNCLKQIMRLQVGIVMDGFDEYPMELRRNSFITDLIKGRVFRNSIVVLTSRSTATIHLHSKVDRRVEILGFAQEERDKYISESLDSPDQRKLQDYLKCQPIINGLVYVPLHLAILLYLYKVQSKLPETLTEMNESFILHTIFRSLTKDELTPASPVTVVDNINGLPKNVLDIVKGLSKLAFIGLQNNQLVFSNGEIKASCPEITNNTPGALNGFGLLQAVQHFPKKGAGATVSYNFLHFTMQEFLAALHVSNITVTPYEQQLMLMETKFWNDMYNFMWMMYVGINGINSQTFMQFLYRANPGDDISKLKLSNNIKSDKRKCLHLFQCFMEAKSETVPKEISNLFYNNEINFCGLQIIPYYISSLTLYISKYSMHLQSLNLRDCHIGDVGMSILQHYFFSNPDQASSIEHIDLFGNNSVLLWNVYCAIFGQKYLTTLNWSSLGGVNVEEIVMVMDNNTIVESLNISNNHFRNDDAERIAEVLSNNTTLQELDISNNNISTRGAIAISESLCNKVKFQHLKLSWNNHFLNTNQSTITFSHNSIKNNDIRILANILCKNETVTKLNLSQNKISDNGAKSISNCIEINKSLKEINLSRNNISSIGLKQIAIALQKNQTLLKFNVSRNKITENGAVAISECLKENSTLEELNLSKNEISNSGIISIGEVLQTNATLQLLDISYNKIFDDGVVAFCDYLKRRSRFKELRISWNDGICLILDFMVQSYNMCKMNMDNTGAVLMSALLYMNANLQNLDISHNKISDSGAVAISESLKNNITLQELNLSANEITDDGVVAILKSIHSNSPLHTLNLAYNIVSKSMLLIHNIYEKVKTISSFQISYNEIVDKFQIINAVIIDFKEFDQFIISHKVKLDMQNKSASYVVKVLCFCAKNNNSVKELNISYLDIANEEAKIIAKALQGNTVLQILDISHNSISDDGAVAISESLKNNNTLRELKMSNNEVSDNGIISFGKALQVNATLQMLDLSCNNISDSGLLAFSDFFILKEKNTLHELIISWKDVYLNLNFTVMSFNMGWNLFGNSGVIFASAFLYQNTYIQELDMSRNNISDDGVVAISKCLKNNNTLQQLDMSYNNISNNGIIKLCETLKMNATLQKFDISHNNISDDGAIAISECLKNNSTLQELIMSYNKVSNSGVKNIGKAVQLLDISHNNISDSGAVAISECLKNNYTLEHLDISFNQISNIGIVIISKALQMNTILQILDISHNNISDE